MISYLLEGGVEHRDSAGFRDRLGVGDAQWIRAGRGMLHAEQPTGGRHGLQLWTSLPPTQKFAEPAYVSYRAADIPEIEHDGARTRVITGTVGGVDGPMTTVSPTVLAHVRLEPGASVNLPVDAIELGLYVLDGQLDAGAGAAIDSSVLSVLSPGDQVTLTSMGDQPADVAILGGAPAKGPILFSGPFVMDTPEHMAQTKRDYASGKMGRLDGVPF